MAPLPDYVAGTITLTNNSTAFTGSGTGWLAAGFREGDTILGIEDNPGVVYVVESVTDNDSGTLTQPWDGPTGTYTYRMRYLSDGQRVTAQARQLIEMLGNGNLQAVAGLPGTPNTLMMFTGAGSVVEVPRTDLVSGANYDVQVDTLAERAAYDGSDEGFAVLVANTGDGRAAIYSKNSATSGDWSDPAYVTGPAATLDVGSVTPVAFGSDPDVTLNPVAGGYEFDFELPENATFQSGTITTLDPGEDATFSLSPVSGGYALNLGVPRGPTGDIDGVTPFWQGRITVDTDAAVARAGLGAASLGANTFTGTQVMPTDSRIDGSTTSYLVFNKNSVRVGYVGSASSSNDDFYITADIGDLILSPFGVIRAGGRRITSLAEGIDPADAINKSQLDGLVESGAVIQSKSASYTSNAAITTTVPIDDSPPEITEGTQILTTTITPKFSTSKIRCRFSGTAVVAGTEGFVIAMFVAEVSTYAQQATATISTAGYSATVAMEFEFDALNDGPHTISVRAGPQNTTLRFNGSSDERYLGGAQAAFLIVEEIKQ